MSAVLTYHVRAGQLTALAAGRVFHLPTHKDPSRVTTWEKVQELRSGKHTIWDHCVEPTRGFKPLRHGMPAQTVTERLNLGAASPLAVRVGLYDWPGEYAQRFDGVDNRPGAYHHHSGSAVHIGDRHTGIYVHGWPPCNLKRCVVVLAHWDDFQQAVASEAQLSFAIEF